VSLHVINDSSSAFQSATAQYFVLTGFAAGSGVGIELSMGKTGARK
jgi:hypothetical protein